MVNTQTGGGEGNRVSLDGRRYPLYENVLNFLTTAEIGVQRYAYHAPNWWPTYGRVAEPALSLANRLSDSPPRIQPIDQIRQGIVTGVIHRQFLPDLH